jgi:uncharacterized protein (DUF927 family)
MNDDVTPPPFPITDTLDDDLPNGFFRQNGGIWFQQPPPPLPKPKKSGTQKEQEDSEPPKPIWVCGDLEIEAETADETSNNHGLLLSWIDPASVAHTWAMPKRLVHGDSALIAAALEDGGLPCAWSGRGHGLLKRLLGTARSKRRVRCVDRSGWQGTAFVLPDRRTFGNADVVMQTEYTTSMGAFVARGTLDDWRDNVARYAVGNDLLVLHVSASFAPPLLDILGEPSGGMHVVGPSQSGKTTLLRAAASVFGPGDTSGQIRTWRATTNGLEAVAAETCDLPLFLDETGQATGKEIGETIYLLANQSGKARANRAGGAQRAKNWRMLFLSTGEVSPADKMAEAGLRSMAGQDVRLVVLAADGGREMGVWQELNGMPSAAALSDYLRQASRRYCGVAGPVFLEKLTTDRANDAAKLTDILRSLRSKFLEACLPPDADGQVRSVCSRFALIAAAGELAQAYGILPWPDGEAIRAAGTCFARWLQARGGAEAGEDMKAVEAVRLFIGQHGSGRFEDADRVVINRAGWRRKNADGEWEYCVLPAIWRNEVCRGLDPGRAARVLAAKGLLLGATDKQPAASVRIPGQDSRLRLYRVSGSILSEGASD